MASKLFQSVIAKLVSSKKLVSVRERQGEFDRGINNILGTAAFLKLYLDVPTNKISKELMNPYQHLLDWGNGRIDESLYSRDKFLHYLMKLIFQESKRTPNYMLNPQTSSVWSNLDPELASTIKMGGIESLQSPLQPLPTASGFTQQEVIQLPDENKIYMDVMQSQKARMSRDEEYRRKHEEFERWKAEKKRRGQWIENYKEKAPGMQSTVDPELLELYKAEKKKFKGASFVSRKVLTGGEVQMPQMAKTVNPKSLPASSEEIRKRKETMQKDVEKLEQVERGVKTLENKLGA